MSLEEIEIQIGELEERVDRLRALYDQYFSGIEKLEPLILRKEVDRRLWMLRKVQIRNTRLRFKLQTVVQRYNTFQQYWARICRDIENGTYRRDMAKAAARFGESATQTALGRRRQAMFEKGEKKRAEREAARKDRPDPETGIEQAPSMEPSAPELLPRSVSGMHRAFSDENAQQPAGPSPLQVPGSAPRVALGSLSGPRVHSLHRNPFAESGGPTKPAEPPSRPRPQPVPSPGSEGELSDARLRQIYSSYVETKRQHGESTASLTFEGLAKTLRSTAPQIREKHKAKAVDFEVVVRDGKTMLKPVLKG